MITQLFNRKNRFVISLVYLLVFSLLLTSCYTVTSSKVSPETLVNLGGQISNATHLVLKDGTYIPLQNKQVFYLKEYKDNTNVVVIKDAQGLPVKDTATNVTRINFSERIIPIDNIKEIYVEKREISTENTILMVIGIVAGAALLFVLGVVIYLASHPIKSCPYIYSFDGTNYVLDAEPLGGAICEGLERTDVSRLENLNIVDGKFKIMVKNVNDEQQRIDELKFLNVKHNSNEFVAPDFNRKFFKYKSTTEPQSVINEDGIDITKFFAKTDNVKWLNELPMDTLQKSQSSKEKLTLKFPRPKYAKNAMLLINGGASYFGSNMIKEVLDLKGNKVDDWYKSIYPGSDEQKKMFNVMHRDESYYMDIKIAEGNTLRNTGIMRSNGPMIDEDVLYYINLENQNSDLIEIVLTPQRHFWKFDRINIIYDYEEVIQSDVETLKVNYAKDNFGNDVAEKLSSIDKNYYRMPNVGDRTDIYINAPLNFTKETNEIFVETTGWYDINLAKNTEPKEQLLENIFSSEGGLFKYALEMYYNNLKNITLLYNFNKQNEN